MLNHVFIIPEPHIWDKPFINRMNYQKEIEGYLTNIMQTIASFEGEKYIIFPGDVFHRDFKTFEGLLSALTLFHNLNELTHNHVYSCVGNHELTYSKNNPFWFLCTEYPEAYAKLSSLQGFGSITPGIKVVDSLAVGNSVFEFGHFDREYFNSDYSNYKHVILITHKTLMEQEIENTILNTYHRDIQLEYCNTSSIRNASVMPLTPKLDYIFVGHLHTAYSSFNMDEIIKGVPMKFLLQYLGSLGRTTSRQVDNTDLVRTIPHFVINDTVGADDFKYDPISIILQPREAIVLEMEVVKAQETYQMNKCITDLNKTNIFGDSPMTCMMEWTSANPFYSELFQKLVHNEPIDEIKNLIMEASKYQQGT